MHCKGEHAPQLLNTVAPHFLIEVDNDFCVGVGGEVMAASLKFGTQLLKVVDFSVENHAHGAVFVKDRLMSARNINDAETPDA